MSFTKDFQRLIFLNVSSVPSKILTKDKRFSMKVGTYTHKPVSSLKDSSVRVFFKEKKTFLGGFFLHLHNYIISYIALGYCWALTTMAMTSEWLRGVTFSGFGFRRLVHGSGVTFSGFSFDRQVHGSGVTFPGFGFGFRLRFLIVHDSNQVTLVTGKFIGLEVSKQNTMGFSERYQ